ncbi:hypothetical protein AVEN_166437-1 [Araneus ventricosus]|uniref:Uncharacterized protein n=1 Tax=Araneus ventricosus TaxID=182803 RepID=A0A4Y2F1P5_ARAVE|nr:hypothetical protein AVEN_166437-1 [Araneus ventricosus]
MLNTINRKHSHKALFIGCIKKRIPAVSRMKTNEKEGFQGEIDPGVSTQSTKAQNEVEKTLNHIVLKIGTNVREVAPDEHTESHWSWGRGCTAILDFIPFFNFS